MTRFLTIVNNRFYVYRYYEKSKHMEYERFNFIPPYLVTRLHNANKPRIAITYEEYKECLQYDYECLKQIDLNISNKL